MREKCRRRSKKLLLSAVVVQNRLDMSSRLLNDLKTHGNRILIFSDEKTFFVDHFINKQNERVIAFGNDVSEQRVFGDIMMLGVVASNGEKMPPLWFERGSMLTPAIYREVLETKVLPCQED